MVPSNYHELTIEPMRVLLTLTSIGKKLDMIIATICNSLMFKGEPDAIQQYKRYRQAQQV